MLTIRPPLCFLPLPAQHFKREARTLGGQANHGNRYKKIQKASECHAYVKVTSYLFFFSFIVQTAKEIHSPLKSLTLLVVKCCIDVCISSWWTWRFGQVETRNRMSPARWLIHACFTTHPTSIYTIASKSQLSCKHYSLWNMAWCPCPISKCVGSFGQVHSRTFLFSWVSLLSRLFNLMPIKV